MSWKEKVRQFRSWLKEEYAHYKVTDSGELKHSIETRGPKITLKEELVDFIHGSLMGVILGLLIGLVTLNIIL